MKMMTIVELKRKNHMHVVLFFRLLYHIFISLANVIHIHSQCVPTQRDSDRLKVFRSDNSHTYVVKSLSPSVSFDSLSRVCVKVCNKFISRAHASR